MRSTWRGSSGGRRRRTRRARSAAAGAGVWVCGDVWVCVSGGGPSMVVYGGWEKARTTLSVSSHGRPDHDQPCIPLLIAHFLHSCTPLDVCPIDCPVAYSIRPQEAARSIVTSLTILPLAVPRPPCSPPLTPPPTHTRTPTHTPGMMRRTTSAPRSTAATAAGTPAGNAAPSAGGWGRGGAGCMYLGTASAGGGGSLDRGRPGSGEGDL